MIPALLRLGVILLCGFLPNCINLVELSPQVMCGSHRGYNAHMIAKVLQYIVVLKAIFLSFNETQVVIFLLLMRRRFALLARQEHIHFPVGVRAVEFVI